MTPGRQTANPQALWQRISADAVEQIQNEPILADYLNTIILNQTTLATSQASYLACKLACPKVCEEMMLSLFLEAYAAQPELIASGCYDLEAIAERDAAWRSHLASFLFFKGYQALQAYRVANYYWKEKRYYVALLLQSQISEVFDVDIHPAATLGRGVFIDHAHAIVIGETAVVEDNVSMLHGVTLGGTGKMTGQRHPTIRHGVLISAGAKILGNIEVGERATVAASSVVLTSVPPHVTVAGIPACIVGESRTATPARDMSFEIKKVPESCCKP